MLGRLVASLENPGAAQHVLDALGATSLPARLAKEAETEGCEPAQAMARVVRGFLNTASNDHFVQLIGIMNRSQEPGLAAIRAILEKSLPDGE